MEEAYIGGKSPIKHCYEKGYEWKLKRNVINGNYFFSLAKIYNQVMNYQYT